MQKDYVTSVRPTQHRLLTAMGISTCAVAALLALLGLIVDMSGNAVLPHAERGELLSVLIRNITDEPVPELSTDDAAGDSVPISELAPAEIMERKQAIAPVSPPGLADEAKPTRDWYILADLAAQAVVDEHFRQAEIRDSMWRQTHSEMFRPAEENLSLEEEPVLSDLQFIPQIHVFGLGVTIGSCFIGLPLVGVPVEKRSTMITFFVCAGDSG